MKCVVSELVESDGRIMQKVNLLYFFTLQQRARRALDDQWTVRVATDVKEACTLTEAGFEYITGEYGDGGKIFRKGK